MTLRFFYWTQTPSPTDGMSRLCLGLIGTQILLWFFAFGIVALKIKASRWSDETNRNLTIPEPCRLFHPNLIFHLCSAPYGRFTRENQTSLNSDVIRNFLFALSSITFSMSFCSPIQSSSKLCPESFGLRRECLTLALSFSGRKEREQLLRNYT